jgi:hypothetical protein
MHRGRRPSAPHSSMITLSKPTKRALARSASTATSRDQQTEWVYTTTRVTIHLSYEDSQIGGKTESSNIHKVTHAAEWIQLGYLTRV